MLTEGLESQNSKCLEIGYVTPAFTNTWSCSHVSLVITCLNLPTPKKRGHTITAVGQPKQGTSRGSIQARNTNSSVNGAWNERKVKKVTNCIVNSSSLNTDATYVWDSTHSLAVFFVLPVIVLLICLL